MTWKWGGFSKQTGGGEGQALHGITGSFVRDRKRAKESHGTKEVKNRERTAARSQNKSEPSEVGRNKKWIFPWSLWREFVPAHDTLITTQWNGLKTSDLQTMSRWMCHSRASSWWRFFLSHGRLRKLPRWEMLGFPGIPISAPTGSKAYSVPGATPGFTYPSHLTCAQGGSGE